MATFLDKKQRVMDLKLTSYGHHLFSVGAFKPAYYAFFDDNVIYDGAYMADKEQTGLGGAIESQNNIVKRIKQDTPYLEGMVLFEDLDNLVSKNKGHTLSYDPGSKSPTQTLVRKDSFKFDQAIGDAHLDGQNAAAAPAWKIILLNGKIDNISKMDTKNNLNIPQIDITVNYKLTTRDGELGLDPGGVQDIIDETIRFSDGKTVALEAENLMIYVDEVNTEFLTENFDVEVFHRVTGSLTGALERKYFEKEVPQIVDGMMMMPRKIQRAFEVMPSSSVEYYFNIYADQGVDHELACKGLHMYNRDSYYIDLDFQCDGPETQNTYFDIYGSEVEPEICD